MYSHRETQSASVTSLPTIYAKDNEEGKKAEVNIGVSLVDASQSSITLANYYEENTGSEYSAAPCAE